MAYVHGFGIINNIEEYKENELNTEKYNCIFVDGDFIDKIYHEEFGDKMKRIKTFAHNLNNSYNDLAYYGITLIPPSSLKEFLEIIIQENIKYQSQDFSQLIIKIAQAIENNKWMIHYGV